MSKFMEKSGKALFSVVAAGLTVALPDLAMATDYTSVINAAGTEGVANVSAASGWVIAGVAAVFGIGLIMKVLGR